MRTRTAKNPVYRSPDFLFELRLNLSDGPVRIRAWNRESPNDNRDGYQYLELEVTHNSEMLFERGVLYGAINAFGSIVGDVAKELAIELLAMHPVDTDDDYFESYTERQLAWVIKHSDELSLIKEERYGAEGWVECRVTARCGYYLKDAVAYEVAAHVRSHVRGATNGYTSPALNVVEDVCMGYYL